MILLDTTVKVKRSKAKSGNLRALVATATGEASIQPATRFTRPGEVDTGRFGTEYVAFVEVDLPVAVGDVLSDPDGILYNVMSIVKNDVQPFPHQELMLVRKA